MNDYEVVLKEIYKITQKLIEIGLADDYNFPSEKCKRGIRNISWGKTNNLSIALKNISYEKIYDELEKSNHYNFKMADGGLIQLLYKFDDRGLLAHRLALFSSPYLEHYQNNPEIYEQDEIYADIIEKNIVAFPIRFDFNREETDSEFEHPFSHATLGQYKNCRIPVYGPMSPIIFINFILKNFYATSYKNLLDNPLSSSCNIINTIRGNEENKLHFDFSE